MKKTSYAFSTTDDMLDRIRAVARQLDRSIAWVIRDAIAKYLETKEKELRA